VAQWVTMETLRPPPNARFRENDSYTEMATKIRPEVREIVFTAPDRATVRFALLSDEVLAPGEQVGEAVLIDGTWKVSIETACALHRLGGVECEL